MERWQIIILVIACIIFLSFIVEHRKEIPDILIKILSLILMCIVYILIAPLYIFGKVWMFLFLRNQVQCEKALVKEYERLFNIDLSRKKVKIAVTSINIISKRLKEVIEKTKQREGVKLLKEAKWSI